MAISRSVSFLFFSRLLNECSRRKKRERERERWAYLHTDARRRKQFHFIRAVSTLSVFDSPSLSVFQQYKWPCCPQESDNVATERVVEGLWPVCQPPMYLRGSPSPPTSICLVPQWINFTQSASNISQKENSYDVVYVHTFI